jgi:uncharacterized membrane protein YeaQ/YmgE (transglycosylase-associated protein family)
LDLLAEIVKAPFICVGWIIVGAVAGALAHSIMKSSMPLISDIILGLVGAVVGGWIVSLLDIGRPSGGLSGIIVSLLVSTVGAIVVIAVIRVLRGQRVAG